jgi:nicotinate phosphoribosyltransferase
LYQRMRYRLGVSQKAALSAWVNEYQGDLGIALSDIGGFDWFLKDFNLYYAKLFDGCRHDSGDPFLWCEKLIKHYEGLRIDPTTKLAVFSDGLNFQLAVRLYSEFNKRIKTSFGVGTNLTNDMGTIDALQIVIKMVECNGGPVSKRSDSNGKGMCEDPEFDAYFGKVIAEEIGNGAM